MFAAASSLPQSDRSNPDVRLHNKTNTIIINCRHNENVLSKNRILIDLLTKHCVHIFLGENMILRMGNWKGPHGSGGEKPAMLIYSRCEGKTGKKSSAGGHVIKTCDSSRGPAAIFFWLLVSSFSGDFFTIILLDLVNFLENS